MKTITNYIIDTYILAYDKTEFMPVWNMDGKLENKNKFLAYKAKRAVKHIAQLAHTR